MDVAAVDAALAPWREERELQARSRMRIAQSNTARRYWEARADVKLLEDRLAQCGATARACEHCGCPVIRYCNARLVCKGCAKRAWSKRRRKVAEALQARLDAAQRLWRAAGRLSGQEPRLTLLTLTLGHSGDVEADRELLSAAWHRWRAWYLQHYGERLAYAWTVEYTPGRDGKGHVHLHVCTMLPFRRFEELQASWARATQGQGHRIHVSQRTRGVRGAARYVAKYATKGVESLEDPKYALTREQVVAHAAAWIRAQHGKRALSTSRGFFLADERYVCPAGEHRFDAWQDVAGWTPSYARAIPPTRSHSGPADSAPPLGFARAGPFSGGQLTLPGQMGHADPHGHPIHG